MTVLAGAASRRRLPGLDRAAMVLLVLAAANLSWIYLKYLLLQKVSGYLLLARSQGRSVDSFGWLERLYLYQEDILLALLVMPLLGAALALLVRGRSLLWLVGGLLVGSVMAMFISMLALANVGRFLSPEMMREALLWAHADPTIIPAYVSASALLKALAMIGLSLALLLVLDRARDRSARLRSLLTCAGGLLLTGAALACLAGQAAPLAPVKQARSALRLVVAELGARPNDMGVYQGHDVPTLQQDFCGLSHSPCRPPSVNATARRKDVIVFVLETAPLAFVDPRQQLQRYPALARHTASWRFYERHFSGYPYTSDAMFSIFASLYPDARRAMLKTALPDQSLGWVAQLAAQGYSTRQYAPVSDTFEDDQLMFRRVGFAQRYLADRDPGGEPAARQRMQTLFEQEFGRPPPERYLEKLTLDYQAWLALSRDVLAWKRSGQRFVVAFAPQIGHAPWPDLLGREADGYAQRGAVLARLQLSWLEGLVRELERDARLDETLIVLTGDHGLRTKTEYADLPLGVMSGVTSNVPLMIFDVDAPPLPQPVPVTSHVDLGPTILARLGVTDRRPYVEGMSIDDPEIAERITLFPGVGYLGVEGLHDHGRFLSLNESAESCSTAGDAMMGHAELDRTASCRTAFERFHQLQRAVLQQFRALR